MLCVTSYYNKCDFIIRIVQNIASTTHITKGLRLQKMKTDVKKKKIPKCPGGCQSLPHKLGSPFLYSPEKLKASSSVLVRFCAGSKPARGESEIRDGEDL